MKERILFVILGHGSPADLLPALNCWKQAAGDHAVLLVHGGRKEDFLALDTPDKIWVNDPQLRTVSHPVEKQSYTGVWRAVAEWMGSRDFAQVYWAEFDELPVVPDPGTLFQDLMHKEKADVLGRRVRRVDGTSDAHWLYHESDPSFSQCFREVSRRENKKVILSMLGTGSFWTRKAFLETAAHPEKIPCYLELFLPTMAHHLGFRVRDFGKQSRFIGVSLKSPKKLRSEMLDGAWTIHPVKVRTNEELGELLGRR